MIEIRTNCENCNVALPPNSDDAIVLLWGRNEEGEENQFAVMLNKLKEIKPSNR